MNKIKSAELEQVCGISSALPVHTLPEYAFAGRSNVGKSSLINALLERKRLARTSQDPGKTQTINVYNVNKAVYLVDLPGYGYARTSRETRAKWGKMIERYLRTSEALRTVFLLVDMRHEPTADDRTMIDWIRETGYTPVVIMTKADKLSKNEQAKMKSVIRKALSIREGETLIPFSAVTKAGREEILELIRENNEGE
ncbi:MAG: YihA family ribosome biogenesis GTP-binding protein [Lachnospiraceae bacterium]|nr:YihA family ribosome biogenesis GTP-binding protein [Lachnospiraceae bacterium]